MYGEEQCNDEYEKNKTKDPGEKYRRGSRTDATKFSGEII